MSVYQQAIGGQLENVCIIRRPPDLACFDFNRDELAFLFDQVVWLAHQVQLWVVKRLLHRAPIPGVAVDYSPSW